MQPPIAELITVQTSLRCVSYRLVVRDAESLTAPARVVWMNRAFAHIPESHAGCRTRAHTFAVKEGYRIIDRPEVERRRAQSGNERGRSGAMRYP